MGEMIGINDTIRLATPDDYIGIMLLVRRLHMEIGQHPLNEAKVAQLVARGIGQQNAIIGVVGLPHELRGMICITIEDVYYSDDMELVERWNYVAPEHRKSDLAKKFILFAKRCSDELGLDLSIGVLCNVRMEAKVRLYRRLLPKAGEFFFHKSAKRASLKG